MPIVFDLPFSVSLVKICSKKLNISGSSDSKKLLDMGKYSLPQYSDVFENLSVNVCLHTC